MPPGYGVVVYSLVILGLFWLDHDRKARTSGALWLAVTWLSLSGSRSVAQWLDVGQSASIDSMTEGSPLDRVVYLSLIIVALVVLARRRETKQFIAANLPIVFFFVYCAISLLWSDYPDVAFKRWTKAFGDFAMILLVLSDRNRLGAIKRLLSRSAFLLIPISILVIKYYPDLGRGYSRWEGTTFYNGVATTKNSLGMICLLFGLGALWRLFTDSRMGMRIAGRRQLLAQASLFAMTVWLCWVANSMTSLWCLMLGGTLLTLTTFVPSVRRPIVLHLVVAAIVLVPFSTLFLGVGEELTRSATNRDITTLTDRTEIWKVTLSLAGNSLCGTGFESFWLGPRLQRMWSLYWWHPTQTHNGYLEVFLNLGWIGVAMLAVVIATGYRTVTSAVQREVPGSALMLTLFAVGIIYNFTEAAFFRMMTPAWILFLLAITKVPRLDQSVSQVAERSHKVV